MSVRFFLFLTMFFSIYHKWECRHSHLHVIPMFEKSELLDVLGNDGIDGAVSGQFINCFVELV